MKNILKSIFTGDAPFNLGSLILRDSDGAGGGDGGPGGPSGMGAPSEPGYAGRGGPAGNSAGQGGLGGGYTNGNSAQSAPSSSGGYFSQGGPAGNSVGQGGLGGSAPGAPSSPSGNGGYFSSGGPAGNSANMGGLGGGFNGNGLGAGYSANGPGTGLAQAYAQAAATMAQAGVNSIGGTFGNPGGVSDASLSPAAISAASGRIGTAGNFSNGLNASQQAVAQQMAAMLASTTSVAPKSSNAALADAYAEYALSRSYANPDDMADSVNANEVAEQNAMNDARYSATTNLSMDVPAVSASHIDEFSNNQQQDLTGRAATVSAPAETVATSNDTVQDVLSTSQSRMDEASRYVQEQKSARYALANPNATDEQIAKAENAIATKEAVVAYAQVQAAKAVLSDLAVQMAKAKATNDDDDFHRAAVRSAQVAMNAPEAVQAELAKSQQSAAVSTAKSAAQPTPNPHPSNTRSVEAAETNTTYADRFEQTYLAPRSNVPTPTPAARAATQPQEQALETEAPSDNPRSPERSTASRIGATAIDIGIGMVPGVGPLASIANLGLKAASGRSLGTRAVDYMGSLEARANGIGASYGQGDDGRISLLPEHVAMKQPESKPDQKDEVSDFGIKYLGWRSDTRRPTPREKWGDRTSYGRRAHAA